MLYLNSNVGFMTKGEGAMTDQSKKEGLASYLGKYADRVFFDNQPIIETDEYSLNTFCRVKIRSDDGDAYQEVPLGPTEVYTFPDGNRAEPTLKGILDGEGYLVPCHKNEKGDFEIITEDQQIQVIPSAENVAKASNLPRTILKINMQNRQAVFQSEETIKDSEGKTFRESEAYTLTHMSGGKPVGPIEYYMQPQNGRGNAEFFGVLGADGQLVPCTRNSDGNFEFTDEKQQKQVIISAENELKNEPKHCQVMRTDYFMGRPILQKMVKEMGSTYTLTGMRGDQPVAPTEYYTVDPTGKVEFAGILDADGHIFPCTRNSDGDFEIDNGDGQKQVVESMANVLKNDPTCKIVRTNYTMGQPGEQETLPNIYAPQKTASHSRNTMLTQSAHYGNGSPHMQSTVIPGPRGPKGEEGPGEAKGPQELGGEDNLFSDLRAKDKLNPVR